MRAESSSRAVLLLIILYGLTIWAYSIYWSNKITAIEQKHEFVYDVMWAADEDIKRLRYQAETINRNAITRNTKNLAVCEALLTSKGVGR